MSHDFWHRSKSDSLQIWKYDSFWNLDWSLWWEISFNLLAVVMIKEETKSYWTGAVMLFSSGFLLICLCSKWHNRVPRTAFENYNYCESQQFQAFFVLIHGLLWSTYTSAYCGQRKYHSGFSMWSVVEHRSVPTHCRVFGELSPGCYLNFGLVKEPQ